jgi:endonuclease/exonuclease/phosphatase family metal-dependent hydrolase
MSLTVVMLSLFRVLGYFSEPRLTDAQIHEIVGEPAIAPASRGGSPLTVVSWNIERGVQLRQIATTLQALSPDVVLLQEVDRYCRRSGNHDVARELARALGMNWVSAGEFQEIGEASGTVAAVTGQAILSREPITGVSAIVFNDQTAFRWRFNPMQPRRGGRIALHARTSGLAFYNVHLESGGDDELRASQLNEVLAAHARDASSLEGAVIAGDFNNAVAFQSFMFAGLAPAGFIDALGTIQVRRTSMNHVHPIDWMFVRGVRSIGGRVERIENASDHYPVVAKIARRSSGISASD